MRYKVTLRSRFVIKRCNDELAIEQR